MGKVAGIALLLLVSSVAVACEPTEYIEARDWKPAKLNLEFCKALAEHDELNAEFKLLIGKEVSDDLIREQTAIVRAMKFCSKQAEMYVRVVRNVHNTEFSNPTCKATPIKR